MKFETLTCKARIPGNSGTIGETCNAAGEHLRFIGVVDELIEDSLALTTVA